MKQGLQSLSDELVAAVERIAPSVVAVHGRHRFPSNGVIWRPGVVVTAEHTLKREEEITVSLPGGGQADGTPTGRDPGTDLAVLRVEGAQAAAPAGDASTLRAGHIILAVGRSPENGPTAALGVISAAGDACRTWRGGQLDRYLRLDVAAWPGLSGAAVVDVSGAVAGIATAALSRIAPLAVPASTVDRVVTELLAKGHVSRGYLGVGLQPVAVPARRIEQLNVTASRGVIVLSVEPGGPAEKSGLMIGDVLLALNGKVLADTDDVQAALAGEAVGRSLDAVVFRAGNVERLQVAVGERPQRGR